MKDWWSLHGILRFMCFKLNMAWVVTVNSTNLQL